MLRALAGEGLFRIVLIHHPVTAGAVGWRKALADADLVRRSIRAGGAELVLHGHAHLASTESIPGATGPIPVVGAPSASARPGGHGPPAGWRGVEVVPSNDAWRLVVTTRTMQPDGTFAVTEDFDLMIPRGSVPAA